MKTKTCKHCGKRQSIEKFQKEMVVIKGKQKEYIAPTCNSCYRNRVGQTKRHEVMDSEIARLQKECGQLEEFTNTLEDWDY